MFAHRRGKRAANVDLSAEQEGGTGRNWPKFLKNFMRVVETFHVMESEKNPYTFA